MGTLYVVATPIGNLKDITLRAIEVLQQVSVIACEDSRITGKLLAEHHIKTPLTTYHQHSSAHKIQEITGRLKEGENIALVTDAGTPGIQDPGGKLVAEALEAGINIEAVPGPSAITAALSIAGVNSDAFCFLGFLPKKKGRQTLMKHIKELDIPLVIYESPMRVIKTITELEATLDNCQIIAMRELTKKFAEIKRGTAKELIKHFSHKKPKGEFVIIVLPGIY
ncbi:16S rRNA (cytidine(1402)-2'-O)-methyltransferase [Patescibacteria group bacterium]|nr:16S rRNA (cytidine(1402)-2'-O)-methyltransferase [Patescibacteria group bacterium]